MPPSPSKMAYSSRDTGSSGPCGNHDRGSALVCDGLLYGVTIGLRKDCIRVYAPTFYVDVTKYESWIRSRGDRYEDPEDYDGDEDGAMSEGAARWLAIVALISTALAG